MAACLVCCVSRILFRRSLAMDVRFATYSVRLAVARLLLNNVQLTQHTRLAATAPTQRNDVNH